MRRNRFTVSSSLFVGLVVGRLLATVPLVAAQQPLPVGSLAGTVKDSSGRLIPDALVTVTELESLASLPVRTDSGRYGLARLRPGYYRVTARRIGFTPATVDSVRIEAGQTRVVDLRLSAITPSLPAVEATKERLHLPSSFRSAAPTMNQIDADEIAGARGAMSLLEVLQQRRPLLVPSGRQRAPPTVYVDGFRWSGDANAILRSLSPQQVESVRLLDQFEAYLLKGSEAKGSILWITLKPAKKP